MTNAESVTHSVRDLLYIENMDKNWSYVAAVTVRQLTHCLACQTWSEKSSLSASYQEFSNISDRV